jgi:cell wall-associated NlpC family hydrolase
MITPNDLVDLSDYRLEESELSKEDVKYKDLLGVPFKMGGRDLSKGLDCYGLCMEIAFRADSPIHEFHHGIEDLVDRDGAIADGKTHFKQVDKPEPYCIVTFKIHPPFVTHMGIVLPDCKRFIHILEKKSVSIAKLSDKIWTRKLDGFYRFIK